jgi:hypothetical protein
MIVALWVADHSIRPPLNYDSGLYHLASVRWTSTYSIVPGLGNLHGRLAFNSSYFLYVAMFEVGPWLHKSHHVANGLLLQVLLTHLLLSGFEFWRDPRPKRAKHIFSLLLIPAVIRQVIGSDIASPTPDLAVFALGIVLSLQLLSFVRELKAADAKDLRYKLFMILALSVIGVTVKLSFLAFGAASAGIALLVVGIYRRETEAFSFRKALGITAFLAAVAVIPWMARGFIVSGYPAYPSTLGAFPVEWRIPIDTAAEEAKWIRSWSRLPGPHWSEVLGKWNWIGPWTVNVLKKHREDVLSPLALVVAAVIFSLWFRKSASGAFWLRQEAFVLLPAAASLVFWFSMAPSPRFAGASFWVLAATALTFVITRFDEWNKLLAVCVIVYLWVVSPTIPPINGSNFYGPGPNHGFYPTPPANPKTFITRSGLVLYVPTDRDLCWDAPLPCTPYPRADLRLRSEGDMSAGFLVDKLSIDEPAKSVAYH